METNLTNNQEGERPPISMYVGRSFANPGRDNLYNMDAFHFAVGSILGDGHIHRERNTLVIANKSPSFTLWKKGLAKKFGLLSDRSDETRSTFYDGPLFDTPITIPLLFTRRQERNGPRDPETDVPEIAIRTKFSFETRAWFQSEWRNTFYLFDTTKNKYRKTIPHNINELFTSDLALAIFFLDDGWVSTGKQTRYSLAAGPYTPEECDRLRRCLLNNFNIASTRYPIDRQGGPAQTRPPHEIRIDVDSEAEFSRRIAPFYDDFRANFRGYRTSKSMKNKRLFTKTRISPGNRRRITIYGTDIPLD